jgi:hypothetical protein
MKKSLAYPSSLLGKPTSVTHFSSNSVESPTSSPHAGHFFVSMVEYTTPQMVHTLSDCLLTAILLADIGRKSPRGINEAIHNISDIHNIPNIVPS